MTVLTEQSDNRLTSGDPETLTFSFPALTGIRCMVSVLVSVRSGFSSGTISATWEDLAGGGPQTITLRRSRDDGFQRMWVAVLAIPLGDLSGINGEVVVSYSVAETNISIAAHVTIHSEIEQADPTFVRATAVAENPNTASPITATLASTVADDICEAVITLNTTGRSLTTDPLGKELVIWDPNGPGGTSGMVWRDTSTGGNFPMAANYTGTAFVLEAAIAYVPDPIPPSPLIGSVTGSRGAGKSVPPDDTNIDVQVTDADLAGTTRMYLADDTNFATATLEEQTISAITAIDLNWDAVTLGVFEEGPLFLFVVVDADVTPNPSAAFPVIISAGEVLAAGRLITLTGSESGPTTLNTDLEFVPHGAWIRANGNTVRGSFNSQVVNSICSVDDSTSMGICNASDGAVAKRQQSLDGTNTLIVLDPTSEGASEQVLGTPSLTDNGLDVNFIASSAGIELLVFFFGGNTFRSHVAKGVASDGAITGVPFKPEFGIFFSCNLTDGVAGDTTFSRCSLGFANAVAAGQQVNMAVDSDGSTRNTVLSNGIIVRQLSQTTVDYALALTGFTSDGMTWSGGGGEGDAFVAHLFDLDGAGSFVQLWAKEATGVDALEELLPDSGLDDLRFIFQMNASRSDTDASPNIGHRWDTGAAGNIAQHSELNVHNPANGPGTAEQKLTLGVWAEGTDSSSVVTLEGEITAFERQSTVRWNINPPEAIQFGLFGWETLGDAKFITSFADDSGLGFVGTVGEPQVNAGAVTVADDTQPAFVGFVPADGMLVFGSLQELEHDVLPTFVGIVPLGHRVEVGDDYTIDQPPPTFAGTVPSPTIPVPGPTTVSGALPSFVGVVPSASLAFSTIAVEQSPPGFVGTVPQPALGFLMTQGPHSFVGTVPSHSVQSGSRTIVQNPVGFVGVVSEGALLTGAAPVITQAPLTFVGTVPAHSVALLLEQLPAPFVGTVPTPIILAGVAPAIQPDPPGFVGVVPVEGSINMDLGQAPPGFVGVVPAPFAVILRDPPGRRHMSLGLGA